MKRKLTLLSAIFTAALLSTAVNAGPLDMSVLSADANWVVHADYDMFSRSNIGKLVRKELAAKGIEEKLQNFETVFSLHPIDDIRNVTIYGKGKDKEKAVAIIQGTFNQEKLVALVNLNTEYEKRDFEGHTIHSWIDEKKADHERQYGCFHNDDTLLMSSAREAVELALDVLDGRADNASDKKSLTDFLRNYNGVFLTAAAEKIYESAENIEEVAVLEKMSRLAIAVGEYDSRIYLDMTLQARSAEDALNVQQFLQGIIAMVSLSQTEEMPQISQLLSLIKISLTEDVVQVHFDIDSRELVTILKELSDDINIEAEIDV